MKKKLILFFAFTLLLTSSYHFQPRQNISIVPKPVKMAIAEGEFKFTSGTKIIIGEETDELLKLGELVASSIKNLTGWRLTVKAEKLHKNPKGIVLLQIRKNMLPDEAYTLEIKPDKIVITAGSGAGIFYAEQSLFQMMPVNVNNKKYFTLPSVLIEDSPRFKWRGMHLDVCRHLFPLEFIKKYIDALAMYKMNKFHWHLTDDQGWRIEIKQYPMLTEKGAYRKETMGDGIPYGGFYTRDQIKEIVAYANARYITVVPEIEMPGHALAAITAYPELSCTGGPFEVCTKWGVFDDVFCAGNEKVFDFLENVLTEVISLFPGEYIHIGGDECPKVRWKECAKCQAKIKDENLKNEAELQSYFVQRIEKFLNSKGKKIIGWDEILEGGLAPNAAVMSWRGIDGGIAAAKAGHNVVMTPGTHCYFDHYQGLSGEPKAIGGFTPLEKIYSYEPVPEALREEEAKYIMGAQANLWTEYIATTEYAEYMLLPRLCALSEVDWSPKSSRNYDDFSLRMTKQYDILSKKKYNYRVPTPFSESGEIIASKELQISMTAPIKNSNIFYTIDGTEPTLSSLKYSHPLTIKTPTVLKAKTFLDNGNASVASLVTVSFIDSSKNGLNYKYYEGHWEMLPDFDSMTPLKSGNVYRLSLNDVKPREDFYGISYDGFLNIEKEGPYTFYLSSDDGSRVFFDNKELLNNDGLHGIKEVSSKINLSAGKYPVKILYFESNGGQLLKLEYEGPGFIRRTIPASGFLRR